MSAPKPLPDDVKSSIAALKLAITTDDEQSDQYLCEMVDDVIAQVVDASHAVPAPEGAGEVVAFVPWRVDPQPDVFDDAGEFEWCVETDEARPVLVCTVPSGVMRPQSAPEAGHASFATANQIVADHNAMRGRPLPSAEAASAELVASVLPLADGLLRDAEDAIAAHAGPGQHVGTPKVTVDALRLRNVARAVAHALRAKGGA